MYNEKDDGKRTAGPLITARSTGISIQVEKHVWDKINGWCNAAHTEVSGMFCVKPRGGGYYVYNAFLPAQNCNGGYTVFNDESYGRLKYYVINKYGVDAMVDLCRGWWHTHYNFSPFWSGTDDSTAQQHMFASEDGWSVSIVINQKGAPKGNVARFSPNSGAHYLARTDILKPVKVTIDDLPVEIVPNSTYHKHKSPGNYKRDIDRWVRPIVYARRPSYIIVPKRLEAIKPEFVNYGGKVLESEIVKAIQLGLIDEECRWCQDFTCLSCKEAIGLVRII